MCKKCPPLQERDELKRVVEILRVKDSITSDVKRSHVAATLVDSIEYLLRFYSAEQISRALQAELDNA